MGTKAILFFLLFFNSLFSFSQPGGLISCTTQTNPDKTISIYANSRAYAEYTLKLNFTSLSGFTSRSLNSPDIALVPVNRGNAEVMKFTRDPSAMSPAFQYKYQYFPGKAFHKTPDTTIEYLMPASPANSLRVLSVSSVVSILSQQTKTEFRGTGFVYKFSDTICASRAGTVFEALDTAREGEKTETIYRKGRNRIQVEQRDGTLGIYAITAPIKLLVGPGDEVLPGQPLAVFDTESDKYRVYFSVCYLDEKKVLADNNSDNTRYYNYIPTLFYEPGDNKSAILEVRKEYTVQHPKNIIAAELTKREKKKLGL